MSPSDPQADSPEVAKPPGGDAAQVQGGLLSGSFLGLLVTQFLGATNDNIFRWLVIAVGKEHVAGGQSAVVLSAGLALFVLPFVLLAAPAGYLADRYSKRTVIVGCKVAEMIVMSLAVLAIGMENLYVLFGVMVLMGSQSALFGPSKLGSIPEMLHPSKISAANGLVGLTTVAATVIGSVVGLSLHQWTGYRGTERNTWAIPAVLVGVAAVGWLASLAIARLRPAAPTRRFPWDAPQQSLRDLRALHANRPLFRVALGIAFFWTVGALAQLNIDQFGLEGDLAQDQIKPLLAALVIGVAGGSVLAGYWSSGRVELGILPLGAAGIVLGSLLLFTVDDTLAGTGGEMFSAAMWWACALLLLLGISAGLFSVPLNAYMQDRSPRASRGSILAAANLVTFAGMLGASGVFYLLRMPTGADAHPLFSARQIFLLVALATVPVFFYIVILIPQASIRFAAWLVSKTVYRIRVFGQDNIPAEGPALLVANHVSWLDGFLLLLVSPRPLRVIAYAPYFERGWQRWIIDLFGVILIKNSPKAIRAALETARQAIAAGEIVAIFPEGSITRTGQLQPFKPGMLTILQGGSGKEERCPSMGKETRGKRLGARDAQAEIAHTSPDHQTPDHQTPTLRPPSTIHQPPSTVPVIPVYLDELWGSIFSYEGGRFFWKRPRRWPYPISIHFGRPIGRADDVHRVRSAVEQLGTEAVQQRKSRTMLLPKAMLRTCRKAGGRQKLADTLGTTLSGSQVLLRTFILRRLLRREVLGPPQKEPYVGVLLPSTVAGVLANAAQPLCGRIAVNLNYTTSADVMNYCIEQCGIRHVLTSRKMMERINVDLNAELVYLEDFKERVTLADKLVAALQAYVLPAAVLDRLFGLSRIEGDDVLTVIFTSGSTGRPKGVMLTYNNLAHNVSAIDQVVHLKSDDVLACTLPFFHSLGYMVTLWAPLTLQIGAAYHANPLEARQVGKLVQQHGCTILIGTPTFLRSYLKRIEPDELQTLDVVIAGAERLPPELADAFEQRFGVRPAEGYGTTETAPLVSVNIPPSRALSAEQEGLREGTVGRPVPGVSVKIVDPESGDELGIDRPGMLLVKGPNVMKGYLKRPEKTAEVIHDGWYTTGDIAQLDEAGFITITGRQSRFSKIGGEMVPHSVVEEAIAQILGGDEDQLHVAVAGVPDERKGERLVVLHTATDKSPEEICRKLSANGLPKIFIPAADSFIQVESIPVLGTGKLDLKAVAQRAAQGRGT